MLKSKFMTWYGSVALSILVPSYILTHIVSIIHMRILIPSCISERIGSISLSSILSIGSIIHIRQSCFHKCIGSIIHIRGYWFHLAFWTSASEMPNPTASSAPMETSGTLHPVQSLSFVIVNVVVRILLVPLPFLNSF